MENVCSGTPISVGMIFAGGIRIQDRLVIRPRATKVFQNSGQKAIIAAEIRP